MYVEIMIIGVLLFVVLSVNGYIKPNKFIYDNQDIFMKLKEDDYDFLVRAKYGEDVEPDKLFQKRINNALIIFVLAVPVCFDNLGLDGEKGFLYPIYSFLGEGSRDLLDLYDMLAEGILMPLGSVLMCVVVGWYTGFPWMKDEIEAEGNKFYCEKFIKVCVKYVTPILMTFVLVSLALSYVGI